MKDKPEYEFVPVPKEKPPGCREVSGWGRSYGLREHRKVYGNGDNRLRTRSFAQPSALRVGDVLATGEKVLSPPREGYNGTIHINIEGGLSGHWVGLPARIPVAIVNSGPKPRLTKKYLKGQGIEWPPK